MTLLSIVRSACDLVGMPRPNGVISGSDQTTRTVLALAQREGRALARRWTWSKLRKEHTWVSVAQRVQTGSVPADFDRMLNGTLWNRDEQEEVTGPLTAEEWQAQLALVTAPVDACYVFRNGFIELYPSPSAGETFAYEYVSGNWCKSSIGTGQAAWTADDDLPVLDEELHILGIVWRFKQGRGLDYAEDYRLYEDEVRQAIQRDGSRRTIRLASTENEGSRGVGVPEGSWSV